MPTFFTVLNLCHQISPVYKIKLKSVVSFCSIFVACENMADFILQSTYVTVTCQCAVFLADAKSHNETRVCVL